jgi:hypothetical protein
VHPAVVADAGGLLVLAGLLEGVEHEVDEILVLDATSLLLAEYLALRNEGAPRRARLDFALAVRTVREWFPARAVAMDAALAASELDSEIESTASLALAESLHVPFVTKNRDLESRRVPVLHC